MNSDEKTKLTQIVERARVINAKVQDLKWELKELAESAWEACGVRPKVVKQLAKEAAWDQVQREAQRQHEESLDTCRAALGLLADLPLGQAAVEASVTDPAVRADGTLKRPRGRPPGSRNKPKLAAVNGAAPPVEPDVPDVPEVESESEPERSAA